MRSKTWFIPALLFVALAAGAAGFGASHLWDNRAIQKLTTERNAARDCRRTGSAAPPCPVIYRNTRIEWHDRIRTVETPDPKQAARIGSLSAELADAHRTIRGLERRRTQHVALAYGWQNGTRQYPYNRSE